MQHVSHFSHLGLIAFDFILLLGRSVDNRPGLVPITTRTIVAGHTASGRTIRNPVNIRKIISSVDVYEMHKTSALQRCSVYCEMFLYRKNGRGVSPKKNTKFYDTFSRLTWCDGDGDGVCVAASTTAVAADVAVREH